MTTTTAGYLVAAGLVSVILYSDVADEYRRWRKSKSKGKVKRYSVRKGSVRRKR